MKTLYDFSNLKNDEVQLILEIIEKLSLGYEHHTALRESILADVLKLVNGDTIISYWWNRDTQSFEHPVFLNLRPEHPYEYYKHFRFCDPVTPRLKVRRLATPVSAIVPQKELEQTEFFNDFLMTDGQYHGINVYAYDRNQKTGDLRIWRNRNKPDFGLHEATLLNIILPHLRNAFRTVNMLNVANNTADFWQKMFENCGVALFLFDEKGHLAFINNEGRKIKKKLSDKGYHLFKKRILALSQKDLSHTTWGSFILSVKKTMSPVNSKLMTSVMVTESISEEVNRDLLRRKHQLSSRETDICLLICKGLTDLEIASVLGIAFSTVRTYMKRVFSKLNATNRSELISCLLEGIVDFSF